MTPDLAATEASGGVASPCINVCKMDAGRCTGCFRSIDEIVRWATAGDEEKRLILGAVVQRRNSKPELATEDTEGTE